MTLPGKFTTVCTNIMTTLHYLFLRYERLLDEYNLDVIPGMVFCPRPKCNTRIASDPQDQLAMCSSCQYPFCKLCRQLWHGDTTVCPATVQVMEQLRMILY